jgi:leucyl-tRNA---protein transferase
MLQSPTFGHLPLDFLVEGEAHPCPYLPGRQAREEFFEVDDLPPELYHDFMDHGFRRSGFLFYRPICGLCRECRPIRVVASEFNPTKSQKRVWRKNSDLDVRIGRPRFSGEKYKIYSDYLRIQHNRSQCDSASQIGESLYSSAVETLEFEYRLRGRLVAASIADLCSRSLSSVYVYFDPEFADRSLGTFSAIREIIFCREHEIPYYYLGFLVADCPSMSYKSKFKPHELLDSSLEWVRPTLGSQQSRQCLGEGATETSTCPTP